MWFIHFHVTSRCRAELWQQRLCPVVAAYTFVLILISITAKTLPDAVWLLIFYSIIRHKRFSSESSMVSALSFSKVEGTPPGRSRTVIRSSKSHNHTKEDFRCVLRVDLSIYRSCGAVDHCKQYTTCDYFK